MRSRESGQSPQNPLDAELVARLTHPEILLRNPQIGFGHAVNLLTIQAGMSRRSEVVEAAIAAIPPDAWNEDLTLSYRISNGRLFTRVDGQGPGRTRIVSLGVRFPDGERRIADYTNVYAVIGNGLAPHLLRASNRIALGRPETIDGVPVWTRERALTREAYDPEKNVITTTTYQYEGRRGDPDPRIKQVWSPPAEFNQDIVPWNVELEVSEGQPLALTVRVPSYNGSLHASYEIKGNYGLRHRDYEEACLYRRSEGKSPTSDLPSQGSPTRESFKSLPEKIDLNRVYDNLASGRPGLEGIWQLQI